MIDNSAAAVYADEEMGGGHTAYDLTHAPVETVRPATLGSGDLVAHHAHGFILRAEDVDVCGGEYLALAEGPIVGTDGTLELRFAPGVNGRPRAPFHGAPTTLAARRRLLGGAA